jgi:hypothetical protein
VFTEEQVDEIGAVREHFPQESLRYFARDTGVPSLIMMFTWLYFGRTTTRGGGRFTGVLGMLALNADSISSVCCSRGKLIFDVLCCKFVWPAVKITPVDMTGGALHFL